MDEFSTPLEMLWRVLVQAEDAAVIRDEIDLLYATPEGFGRDVVLENVMRLIADALERG